MSKKHEYDIEVSNVANPHKYVPGSPSVIAYDYDVYRDVYTLVASKRTSTRWGGYLWALRVIYFDKFKLWIRRK